MGWKHFQVTNTFKLPLGWTTVSVACTVQLVLVEIRMTANTACKTITAHLLQVWVVNIGILPQTITIRSQRKLMYSNTHLFKDSDSEWLIKANLCISDNIIYCVDHSSCPDSPRQIRFVQRPIYGNQIIFVKSHFMIYEKAKMFVFLYFMGKISVAEISIIFNGTTCYCPKMNVWHNIYNVL